MPLRQSKESFTPSIRGGFSHRNGLVSFSNVIQLKSLDNRARVELYNYFHHIFSILIQKFQPQIYDIVVKDFFTDALCEPIQNSDTYLHQYDLRFAESLLNNIFMENPYNEVLDVVEYLINYFTARSGNPFYFSDFSDSMAYTVNSILEHECVGYRYVAGKMSDIINEEQISEVDQAVKTSQPGPAEHISKSIQLLYSREEPDFPNSVKESISAVEAMCRFITESPSATLGEALRKIDTFCPIQPALKSAFSALYGYTSDASGVRHSIADGKAIVTFEEAKFMLVACSAFVNYLTAVCKQ